MKFNPLDWHEVSNGEQIQVTGKRLRVRASQPCAVYLQIEDHEALAGSGVEHDYTFAGEVLARFECAGRVFVEARVKPLHIDEGEVLTNPDRMASVESGIMAQVQMVLRQHQRAQAAALAKAKADLVAAQEVAPVVAVPLPVADLAPAPVSVTPMPGSEEPESAQE